MKSDLVKLLLIFIASALMSAAVGHPVIKLMRSLKAKQTVLGYVRQHEQKNGTPTMGGFIFLFPVAVFSLVFHTTFSLVALALTLGFCVLGFLDDFIKIKFSRNLGLKPYQKIIGQLGLSIAAGFFAYRSRFIGGGIELPLTPLALDLKWGIIPVAAFLYIATTNSVNLTDGLDGLAGYTSVSYFLCFFAVTFLAAYDAKDLDAAYFEELISLSAFCASMLGGLLGYLLFNGYPAKIMMGDTGSLGLGAACASVAVFIKNPLLIAFAGIMFVASSISVIVQVTSFKLTKKRVFLMAPFHHHLEMKGIHESKIVTLYFVVSMIGGALTLIFART